MARKAKHIPRKLLSSDENVVWESRPSGLKFMISASLVMFVGLAALVVYALDSFAEDVSIPYLTEQLDGEYGQYIGYLLLMVFVLALVYFLVKWMRWGSTVYAVTDERIITQKGILSKDYDDIELPMISSVDVHQPFSKRMLGYGTIRFSMSGSAGKKDTVVWEWVPDPLGVRRKVQEVMDIRVKPKNDRDT
jgi:uncharacterized membrane protein YdbT with pleckstrin-like domain